MALALRLQPLELPLKHDFTIARGTAKAAPTIVFRLQWNAIEGLEIGRAHV